MGFAAALLLVAATELHGVADRSSGSLQAAELSDVAVEVSHESHALTFSVAEEIGRAFMACAARKNKVRSIHILDQVGNTLYSARMDGQFADNIEVARMKAEAALYFRENTTIWQERASRNAHLAQLLSQMGQFTSPGGFPIVVEGQLLGSIGVGGASGDCAYEALTEVLGPQSPWTPIPLD